MKITRQHVIGTVVVLALIYAAWWAYKAMRAKSETAPA